MSELLKNWERLSRKEQKKLLLESLQGDMTELTKEVIRNAEWEGSVVGFLIGLIFCIGVVLLFIKLP